jgi:hypothetical protein
MRICKGFLKGKYCGTSMGRSKRGILGEIEIVKN